jgi:hypothetical protein
MLDLREAPFEMQEGCGSKIDMFFGYFFITAVSSSICICTTYIDSFEM